MPQQLVYSQRAEMQEGGLGVLFLTLVGGGGLCLVRRSSFGILIWEGPRSLLTVLPPSPPLLAWEHPHQLSLAS